QRYRVRRRTAPLVDLGELRRAEHRVEAEETRVTRSGELALVSAEAVRVVADERELVSGQADLRETAAGERLIVRRAGVERLGGAAVRVRRKAHAADAPIELIELVAR